MARRRPFRPRYDIALECSAAEAIARMQRGLGAPECGYVGRTVGEHVDLALPRAERKIWSPVLHIEFEDDADSAVGHVLIGPHPNVWTMYAFCYGTLATITFFVVLLGIVQLMLTEFPWGLWVAPVVVLAMGGLWLVSQIGQRLAAEEMAELRAFTEEALRTAER